LEIERFSSEQYEGVVSAIHRRSAHVPNVGLVLGSGLSGVAAEIEYPDAISYGDIPGFPRSTVKGHEGQLVLGVLEGQTIVVMQGRAHYYEGYSMQRVTFPIRVLKLLGVKVLLLTNAAGGLNPDYQVGDLMLIADHINLPGMAGLSPLIGPNDASFGPRFPDMAQPYDAELRDAARRVAERESLPLREGTYVMAAGPNYETPAEVRYLRSIGADAVGMSTAPEVVVARHCGLRVLGVSGITNAAIAETSSDHIVDHEHVLQAGKVLAPRMIRLIRGVLRSLT
jgi:purine-nucleoside phosphorylase